MVSVRCVARAAVVAAMVLLAAGAARAETHAPWPTDWNNWNDPALWVTVGNPGNVGELSGGGAGGYGPDRICGAVAYTYNIGKFEVTAGQYTAFLNAVAAADYGLYNTYMDTAVASHGCNIKRTGSFGSFAYSVAADWANRPVNYVSWGDAARFANWLTNGQPTGGLDLTTTENGSYNLNGAKTDEALLAVARIADGARTPGKKYYVIPTEDEWHKAAYYRGGGTNAGYWDYPTSSNTAPGQDMADASGNNANYSTAPYVFPIDSGKYTTVAGEFQNSDSPYGTFDQGGNVYEWNEAIVSSACRGARGGSFYSSGGIYLQAADRLYYYPTSERYFLGFRISEVPEPATLLLLALGGAALVARRRKTS